MYLFSRRWSRTTGLAWTKLRQLRLFLGLPQRLLLASLSGGYGRVTSESRVVAKPRCGRILAAAWQQWPIACLKSG